MIHETIWLATLSDDERAALACEQRGSLPTTPDVLVIGGGIVGLATAYFLAQRRVGTVLLLERGGLASGASAANAGGVFPGQQGAHLPAAFRDLSMASLGLYIQLAHEPWARFDWRQNGSLAVSPERFPCSMGEHVAREQALGRRAEHLTGSALHELEPALAGTITEAVHYPDDGRLHPVRTALSFARAAAARGATITGGVSVRALEVGSGRISRVRTDRGDIHPGCVVLTTGWCSPELAAQMGVRLPIEPAKGQMLATAPVPWRLITNVSSTMALLQLASGEIIAGGTVEYVGADVKPTAAAADSICAEARRILPALEECPFVRAWAGLRPHTPDDMPVIDRVPGLDRVFIAAGHFKNGVLLAPITGQLLSEWICEGHASMDVSPLRLGRFSSATE